MLYHTDTNICELEIFLKKSKGAGYILVIEDIYKTYETLDLFPDSPHKYKREIIFSKYK